MRRAPSLTALAASGLVLALPLTACSEPDPPADSEPSATPTSVVATAGTPPGTDLDLGGQDVPLYLRDTDHSLGAPWTLGGDFAACQSGPLPDPFEAGAEAEMCRVYLVPDGGRVRDLVFEPTEGYDPITWTGEVDLPAKRKQDQGKHRKQRRG